MGSNGAKFFIIVPAPMKPDIMVYLSNVKAGSNYVSHGYVSYVFFYKLYKAIIVDTYYSTCYEVKTPAK